MIGKKQSEIICELPNGKLLTVSTSFPLSFFEENKTIVGLKSSTNILESKEAPTDISVDKIRFEAEWSNVLSHYQRRQIEQSGIAYWVSTGANKCTCAGTLLKMNKEIGCKRIMYNKEEARLRTNLSNWNPPSQGDELVLPRSIDINICLNLSCVQRAIDKYRKMVVSKYVTY